MSDLDAVVREMQAMEKAHAEQAAREREENAVKVTGVLSRSDDRGGAEWEITVWRSGSGYVANTPPRIDDVPEDVRAAVQRWLDGAR